MRKSYKSKKRGANYRKGKRDQRHGAVDKEGKRVTLSAKRGERREREWKLF